MCTPTPYSPPCPSASFLAAVRRSSRRWPWGCAYSTNLPASLSRCIRQYRRGQCRCLADSPKLVTESYPRTARQPTEKTNDGNAQKSATQPTHDNTDVAKYSIHHISLHLHPSQAPSCACLYFPQYWHSSFFMACSSLCSSFTATAFVSCAMP